MRSRLSSLRRIARDERGFTLPELLTSIAIFGFILTGLLGLLTAGAQHAPRDQERTVAIREAQVGLSKMVRELRQAYKIESTGFNYIRANVRRLSTNTNIFVEYDCGNAAVAVGKCIRRQAAVGGTLPAQGVTAIPHILNSAGTGSSAVFTYSDPINPLYVTVRLEVPSAGGLKKTGHTHKIVYEDGFYIRNLNN